MSIDLEKLYVMEQNMLETKQDKMSMKHRN